MSLEEEIKGQQIKLVFSDGEGCITREGGFVGFDKEMGMLLIVTGFGTELIPQHRVVRIEVKE